MSETPIGTTVQYFDRAGSGPHAAIVTKDHRGGEVNLRVFLDNMDVSSTVQRVGQVRPGDKPRYQWRHVAECDRLVAGEYRERVFAEGSSE